MATKTLKAEPMEFRQETPDADVHHIILRVGMQSMPDGTKTVDEADAYLRTWLQSGYTLTFTHALGLEPNGVNILYILIK